MTRNTLLKLASLGAAFGLAAPAHAAQIILSESAVIGNSGSFDDRFLASNILDRQTGPISESFGNGEYWLNPDGRTPAFITIDLGAAYRIGSVDLFNSRNLGDRATANFEIYAANSTANAVGTGATGLTLGSDAMLLVSGTLARDPSSSSLAAQSFAAFDTSQSFRYLQFRPLSTVTGSYSSTSYGLNELRVFAFDAPPPSAVPEPESWAMMLGGLGVAGALMRNRQKTVAFS